MKFRLSGGFGELSPVREGVHNGIDLAMPEGTTLRSVSDGVVEAIRDYGTKNIGKGVVIRTPNGEHHIYGHLSEIDVFKGQRIHPGDVLGATGNTGHSHGAHLHFGIQNAKGTFIDPTEYAKSLSEMAGNVDHQTVLKVAENIHSHGWIMDKINHFSDKVVNKENEVLIGPVIKMFKELGEAFWGWFVLHLPNIMGYGAMATGVFIILGAMFGKSGMIKPIAIYTALLIIALCILGGV
jgi:hypothetical protein